MWKRWKQPRTGVHLHRNRICGTDLNQIGFLIANKPMMVQMWRFKEAPCGLKKSKQLFLYYLGW